MKMNLCVRERQRQTDRKRETEPERYVPNHPWGSPLGMGIATRFSSPLGACVMFQLDRMCLYSSYNSNKIKITWLMLSIYHSSLD